MKRSHRPTVGLALSGGGARSLAHIGVLKVLEREGIPVDCLAGSSMGGILAAAFAAGISALDLEAEALRMAKLRELIKLVDPLPPRRGLLAGRRLRAYLTKFFPPELTFVDLRLPLALETVDLRSGQEVHITEGSVLEAALATSAFPGVMPPVEWDSHLLVDGGLLNNLPVDLVRSLGAEVVIAVNTVSDPTLENPSVEESNGSYLPDFVKNPYRAFTLMTSAQTQAKLKATQPEIVIHPPLPPSISIFSSFTRAAEIIAIGEDAAIRSLPRLIMATGQEVRPAVAVDSQAG